MREPRELFLLADMQEEFDDMRAVLGEPGLEIANLAIARFVSILVDQLVDAGDQHLFVMRPVEDADLPISRRFLMDAPEKVMGFFVRRRGSRTGRR